MDDHGLQQLLSETATKLDIVGAQLAILQDGEVREFEAGSRNLELGLPVTPDTLFQIGSTTKIYNAALILNLVDQGHLDLDVPVREFLPDFRLASVEAQESITLRQLLSMTSGLDNGPYTNYGSGDDALGRYVDSLSGVTQIFDPGSAFGYSNAGSTVAGCVSTRVLGRPWEFLLEDRILGPLGLQQTAALPEDLLYHPIALGYVRDPTKDAPQRMRPWGLSRTQAPAGATLCASAGDLVRFGQAILGDSGVLSEASLAAFQRPHVTTPTKLMAEKWCLGPYWKNWDGHEIIGHAGGNIGGSSMLLWCPEEKVAAATTINNFGLGYTFADQIFDVVFPEVFGIRKPQTPDLPESARSVTDLDRFVGRFESFRATVTIEAQDRKLFASVESYIPLGHKGTLRTELVPVDEFRFFAREPALSPKRGWDCAFWSDGKSDRLSHYLHGAFPMRRTA